MNTSIQGWQQLAEILKRPAESVRVSHGKKRIPIKLHRADNGRPYFDRAEVEAYLASQSQILPG